MKQLTCVDLFAGMGGTSLGATQAGLKVLVSANHWPVAVATHILNHPDTHHETQDLQQADFYEWPDFDVLLASPACQGHSRARGRERPHHDATRSTAWAVVSSAEAKRPRYLVIENVGDFRRWQLYPQWRSCLQTLGYQLTEQVLNAADFGVPQDRRRLFIVGVHADAGRPLSVPQGTARHIAAETILQERTDRPWRRVNSPKRAARTLERIRRGRERHGSRFILAYYGGEKGGRSLTRPLGTVSTRDRFAIVDGGWMRMLSAVEVRRAMGFPAGYWLPPQHKLAVFLLGNAVCPPVMRHICENIKAHAAASYRRGLAVKCPTGFRHGAGSSSEVEESDKTTNRGRRSGCGDKLTTA